MDMIHDVPIYMTAPQEMLDAARRELAHEGSAFVRIYHNAEEKRWSPVVFNEYDDIRNFDKAADEAKQKGWVFVATLTELPRQQA